MNYIRIIQVAYKIRVYVILKMAFFKNYYCKVSDLIRLFSYKIRHNKLNLGIIKVWLEIIQSKITTKYLFKKFI